MRHLRLFASLALAVVGARLLALAHRLMPVERKVFEVDGLSLVRIEEYSAKLTEQEARWVFQCQRINLARNEVGLA